MRTAKGNEVKMSYAKFTGSKKQGLYGDSFAAKKGSAPKPLLEKERIFEEVVLTPVFSSKKQEALFAKCAKKAMSSKSRLQW